MIGLLNNRRFRSLFFLVFLISCSEGENSSKTDLIIEKSSEEQIEKPNAENYVDAQLLEGEFELSYGENSDKINITIDDKTDQVLNYEGVLVTGFGMTGGLIQLVFVPYDYYDEDLEMIVSSPHGFDLKLTITSEQNDYLDYVNYDSSTDNIKWDYLDNLFNIFYFETENGDLIPLKFNNLGKTEWDG